MTGAPTAVAAVVLALLLVSGCASRPTPIAYHAITIDGRCSETEEDGFREDARLVVDDNRVKALDWQLWVGSRGSCRFALADFRQTREKPQVELVARDGTGDRGGCRLFVWQEPGRVTLAHAGCAALCTPGIYDQAWPALFDPQTGRCAMVGDR